MNLLQRSQHQNILVLMNLHQDFKMVKQTLIEHLYECLNKIQLKGKEHTNKYHNRSIRILSQKAIT